MLRNNADVRRCSYFELGLPVVPLYFYEQNGYGILGDPGAVSRVGRNVFKCKGNSGTLIPLFRIQARFSSLVKRRSSFRS